MYKILTTTWDWKPSVIIGCAIFLIYYLVLARKYRATGWQVASFSFGTLIFFLSLVSPIDIVGDIYLFSVHMFQHILLLLIVPPFWLWGIPTGVLERLRQLPVIKNLERGFTNPFVAWTVGIGTVWLWHIPALYDATLRDQNLHAMEHLTFVISGVIFWWAVMIAPAPDEKRISPLSAVLYLVLAAVSSSILGIVLTYATPGLYQPYIRPADILGLLPTIRGSWGFDLAQDQQTGGLMMWVLGSPLYLAGCLGALARWYRQSEIETAREIAAQLETERMARISSTVNQSEAISNV